MTSGARFSFDIPNDRLQEILESCPETGVHNLTDEMDFSGGSLKTINGVFVTIKTSHVEYKIAPSQFSIQTESSKIVGDASFEGPWDEKGKQVAALFFSELKQDATVYLNGEKCSLSKEEDGTVNLVKC